MYRLVVLSVVLMLQRSVLPQSEREALGFIDRTLIVRLLNLAVAEPTATPADLLYVDRTGLYLLNDSVTISGEVNRVCAFGYYRVEFGHLVLIPNTTMIDLRTPVRLFVYVVLLRKLSDDPSKYFVVYPPIVLHHGISEGCVDVADEFDWFAEPGDRIGVFIPSECIDVRDLPDDIITDQVKKFTMLCPSQTNLVTLPQYPFSSTFLINSSALDIEDINENTEISIEDLETMSLLLNMNATIVQVPGSSNIVTVVVITTTVAAAAVLGLVLVIVMLVYLRWRKRQRKLEDKEFANRHEPLNEDSAKQHTSAYENDGPAYSWAQEFGSYSVMKTTADYDYDEVYFEPASEEDELFIQLETLSVPIIRNEELKICEVLGNGEFGIVYRGVWLHSVSNCESTSVDEGEHLVEEDVAVKCMDDSLSEEDRVKFLQEAAIMAQFNHPNIIKMLGLVTEDKLKIVVNLMKVDLRKHLISLRPKSLDNIPTELGPTLLSFSRQIAFGMMYLSCKSFVHRDLAARNILVSSDGTLCKIADFGLSRDLQNQSHYVSHGGKVPVKWTAPEAINYRKYSTASDVWSYGCVLYEIWSLGYKPFQEHANQAVLKLLKSGYRLPPPPGCPRAIYDIMIKCWHPDETMRPMFMTIVVALQKPDFQILKWPATWSSHELCWKLGAELETSEHLYSDLQNVYKKKKRSTFRKISSRYRNRRTKDRQAKVRSVESLHSISETSHCGHENNYE